MKIRIDFDKQEIRILMTSLSYIDIQRINLNHKEIINKEKVDGLYIKLADSLVEVP